MSRASATRERRPPAGRQVFDVDERLVMPETRYEALDGEITHVCPAEEPHASRHSKLSALLEAYVAEGWNAASDMLTRTSEASDLAPDGSVYRPDPDPETGGRRLEEVAFEVLTTERLTRAGRKAAALTDRGVRRVFAIDSERQRALEWSRTTSSWEILPLDGVIDDPVFVMPLPVHDLVVAAKADDAVARALLAKRNPVLTEALERGRAEGEARGRARGKAEAVVAILRGRGLAVSGGGERQILDTADETILDRWVEAATRCRSVTELFARKQGHGRARRSR
ncbi:MAG: Uma2 family endonuclease [Deltaproteobacteria bacterium]|nr:Uma2 family endonuclease [Deltaproteobacteria bacterium]